MLPSRGPFFCPGYDALTASATAATGGLVWPASRGIVRLTTSSPSGTEPAKSTTHCGPSDVILENAEGSVWSIIGGPKVTILSAATTTALPSSQIAPMQTVIGGSPWWGAGVG